MTNSYIVLLAAALLLGALGAPGGLKEASAQVQVNINIVEPPPLQFASPPAVYVIPSGRSYVYMVPDYDGVYFYGGNWYRFYNNHWFRSSHYNQRWDYIETSMVPQVIIVVPPEYIHYVPSGYHRIHYDDLHSNWQSWDERRHWDSYDWYQNERRDDTRRERHNYIQRDRQQRGAQSPQHQQVQGHQQQNIQKSQKQHIQKQPKQNSQKQKNSNDQKQQKHDGQKQQQGEKEHGGNK